MGDSEHTNLLLADASLRRKSAASGTDVGDDASTHAAAAPSYDARVRRALGIGCAMLATMLLVISLPSSEPHGSARHTVTVAAARAPSRHQSHPPGPSAHRLHAPPPSAPFPPLPPFPQSPPMRLLAEPSTLGTCGHLTYPVDATEVVPYPGGSWRAFAEWSGLDEAAQEEALSVDGGASYMYDEGGMLFSYDGARAVAANAVSAGAKSLAAGLAQAAARSNMSLTSSVELHAMALRMAAARQQQRAQQTPRTQPARPQPWVRAPPVFGLNSDFSLAHGLHKAGLLDD